MNVQAKVTVTSGRPQTSFASSSIPKSIDRVLRVGLPVLLIFDRKGCTTCQQLDPSLERLATTFAGRALLARVDADDNPTLVKKYGITAHSAAF